MFWNRQQRSTWKGLVAGAIGGAVASFAMNQFQAGISKLFEDSGNSHGARQKGREAQGWRQHEAQARQDPATEERADVKAAVAIAETAFRHPLSPGKRERAGTLVHYAMGVSAGALYGAAAEHWDDARAGLGSVFGATLWVVADEVAVPASGLSKGPAEYPLKTHAMALAAHLVYGVTTELARRALRDGVLSR